MFQIFEYKDMRFSIEIKDKSKIYRLKEGASIRNISHEKPTHTILLKDENITHFVETEYSTENYFTIPEKFIIEKNEKIIEKDIDIDSLIEESINGPELRMKALSEKKIELEFEISEEEKEIKERKNKIKNFYEKNKELTIEDEDFIRKTYNTEIEKSDIGKYGNIQILLKTENPCIVVYSREIEAYMAHPVNKEISWQFQSREYKWSKPECRIPVVSSHPHIMGTNFCIGSYEAVALDNQLTLAEKLRTIPEILFEYDSNNPYFHPRIWNTFFARKMFLELNEYSLEQRQIFLLGLATNVEKLTNEVIEVPEEIITNFQEYLETPTPMCIQNKFGIKKYKEVKHVKIPNLNNRERYKEVDEYFYTDLIPEEIKKEISYNTNYYKKC